MRPPPGRDFNPRAPCGARRGAGWETRPQKELAAWQRSGNLLGAFDVRPGTPLAGKCVLLVDDVSTTGATLEECAKMLKIQGAAQVLGIAAALTPGKKEAACQKRESDI